MQEEHLNVKELDLLSSIKEKTSLLEEAISTGPTFELKKLLLDAYLLDHQYEKARNLYAELSN